MADSTQKPCGAEPPTDRGHPMPRRVSPENSVTLQHHRLGRETYRKPVLPDPSAVPAANSPRRGSSGESHNTSNSDPKKWFDTSNRNPTNAFDPRSMDVDPPFYQKEDARPGVLRRSTESSSAEDYRSVIDDLTIENKRLKEELKRYKQFGTDSMRKEKLFEIKVHGLPGWRKRELEATLRDFAAGLEGENDSRNSISQHRSSQHRKSGRHGNHPYYSGESISKHDSSSSSRSRPVDSAYASMSTGQSSNAPNSVGPSLGRPSLGSRAKSSQQKVESYLRDTPDGLLPRHVVMTDKEKKKLVVRRLEQLFTGKIRPRNPRNESAASGDVQVSSDVAIMAPPRIPEASREAFIQQEGTQKKPNSRDNVSTSNSNGDLTDSGGNGMGSGNGGGSGDGGRSGNNTSPPTGTLPEQRPTRPLDLDPDRVQVPSENMNYIRHLGLVPPEFLVGKKASYQDVSPDADGWVYLNLLCNLAQLHMINVTPGFIRAAVNERSTKFQLSPDGRKIRWRGGTVGTRFSSDSSTDNSQKSPSADETDGSDKSSQRKRQKLSGGNTGSGASSKGSKFGPQLSHSSDSFHYKPLFVRQSSSLDSSVIGTKSQSSDGVVEESNLDQWDYSGSGSSKRRKRRHDGAIIYYSGAPFCTDLSGDAGESSPTTYLTSTGQEGSYSSPPHPLVHRTLSGSSLPVRPLSDPRPLVSEVLDMDLESPPDLVDDDEDSPSDEDFVFPWCDDPERVQLRPIEAPLEACGLAGVVPDDHFAVIVTTRRIIARHRTDKRSVAEDTADDIVSRLASMRTSSPLPPKTSSSLHLPVGIEYLKANFLRLNPVSLPPPAMFFPPFSSDSGSNGSEEEGYSFDEDPLEPDSDSARAMSQLANPHHSDGYRENAGESSSEEGGQVGISDDEDRCVTRQAHIMERTSRSGSLEVGGERPGEMPVESLQSSVATAGGAESGYSSSMEDDAQ